MQCKCGSEVKHREHEILTLAKAKDWLVVANLTDNFIESKLPVKVEQLECKCGRYGFKVTSNKEVIYSRI